MEQSIQVHLPNGSPLSLPPASTALDVAKAISPRLAEVALAAVVNGRFQDVYLPLPPEATVEIVTQKHPSALEILRHSTSHVLAQAVKELWPEVKIGMGPVVEDGFYYDFEKGEPFTVEDLEHIEGRMREIVARDLEVRRMEMPKSEALSIFREQEDTLKVELVEEKGGEKVSLYRQGDFEDFCRGPHVPRTSLIPAKAIRLLSVAGAYWKGDERNAMLQRIYGTVFFKAKETKAYLHRLEEAKKRDHRKLGKELGLFFLHEVSAGSPFFQPKGAFIYNTLVDLVREFYKEYGYSEVITPQVFDVSLWKTSGHWDHYQDNMFKIEAEGKEMGVKPMNCPGHCVMFGHDHHSFRDLPVRLADFGRLHRFERSGVVQGLTRVRSFAQDDAHIFCRADQIKAEMASLFEMMGKIYQLFGFSAPKIFLSTRPEDAMGDLSLWNQAEDALRQSLNAQSGEWQEDPGEGAFYGPKIDFVVEDAIGRDWQLATIQLDFQLPERFDLHYVGTDNQRQRPVMIHRAILGSVERFMGILIEHFAGAFPLWLSPVQVSVLPVADRHLKTANKVAKAFSDAGLRVLVDGHEDTVGAKIRRARLDKIPVILLIGDREEESGKVALRTREAGEIGPAPLDEVVGTCRRIATDRALDLGLLNRFKEVSS